MSHAGEALTTAAGRPMPAATTPAVAAESNVVAAGTVAVDADPLVTTLPVTN